ncbi:MAG: hypothetical protein QNJ13_02500 [Paracoccaceae bacterium]|nr:hypothetical protein [Paracoccaceae bacterium]
MTPRRFTAAIHLWSGDFASQQLAFAHLLDAADEAGTALDLDAVEVIPPAEADRRLAPYFGAERPKVSGPTLILLATPPGTPPPFKDTARLRFEGTSGGRVLRAGGQWV